MTAICSVKTMRSVPATGMFRCFSWRTISSMKRPRLRTRIRISPAVIGRPCETSISPPAIQSATVWAMFWATWITGALGPGRSTGASQASG